MKSLSKLRCYSRLLFLGLLSVVLWSGVQAGDAGAAYLVKPFTIAVLPDTQVYCEEEENTHLFERQVQWILDNAKQKNIVFMSHLGDVVDNGRDADQWSRAMGALQPSPAAECAPLLHCAR